MYGSKILSAQNLKDFNFAKTKNNIKKYFSSLEDLEWQWVKFNAQKGLTANYDFSSEYQKQPFIPVGNDMFALASKECAEDELKQYLASYYWAKSLLSEKERVYIVECFYNRKYENDIVELLDYTSSDSNDFRILKRSAVFKFADVLNLGVEKK